ncbi:hypothetical protein Tco_1305308 [Tanacetum coccineum]
MPPGKLEPPDLVVMQSHSGTDYHQPMSYNTLVYLVSSVTLALTPSRVIGATSSTTSLGSTQTSLIP